MLLVKVSRYSTPGYQAVIDLRLCSRDEEIENQSQSLCAQRQGQKIIYGNSKKNFPLCARIVEVHSQPL